MALSAAAPWPPSYTRYVTTWQEFVLKGVALFAPVDGDDAHVMGAMTWLIPLIGLPLLWVLVYVVAGTLHRTTGAIAAILIGASGVFVAAAIVDLVWWFAFILRVHNIDTGFIAQVSDTSTLNLSANVALGRWTSDVLSVGAWLAWFAGALTVLSRHLESRLGPSRQAVGGPPLMGDVRGGSRQLAVAGIIPVFVLALVAGTPSVRDHWGTNTPQGLLEALLYPVVTPPPEQRNLAERLTGEIPDGPEVTMDQWVQRTIIVIVLLVLLWFLLSLVVAEMPMSGHYVAIVVICWGTTIAACALTAPVSILVECGLDDMGGCAPWMTLSFELTDALRFGAVWGWLGALPVLLARAFLSQDTPTEVHG